MRRAVAVVIATLGVLALLASFHSTTGLGKTHALSVLPTQPPAGAPPPASGTTAPPAPGTTAPATVAPASRVIDGPVESNPYGDVQVEIKVANGELVDVRALELPQDRRRSAEISSYAGPLLREEALQAKSANIDIVSGASYTSESYAYSLQGALDQAGL